jgi:type I restriction enzyme S subunit
MKLTDSKASSERDWTGLSVADSVLGEVPRGWLVSTVGEVFKEFDGRIQTGPFGSQLHASDYVEVGVPTVMPANIGDNRIIEEGISRIRPEDVERLKRHKLQFGDIVFSRRGDVERRSLVRGHEVGWLCGTGCLLVRPPSGYVDSAFLSHWFGHPVIRAWLTQHAIGATMLNLNTEILSSVPLVLPPLNEQHAIAGVLGALDDKIGSNRRLKSNLSQLSRWSLMTEVGEVIQHMDGVNGSVQGLPLQGNDLRIVDTGIRNDSDARSFTYLATADVFDNEYRIGEQGTREELPSRANMEPGSDRCWFARMKATPKWLWTPTDYSEEWDSIILSTGFLGIEASDKRLSPIVMTAIRTPEFQDAKNQLCNGTTMQSLNNDSASQLLIRVPLNQSALATLSEVLRTNLLLEHQLNRQSMRLIGMREALLPELLSGRLRVKDAESMMENV